MGREVSQRWDAGLDITPEVPQGGWAVGLAENMGAHQYLGHGAKEETPRSLWRRSSLW